MTLILRNSKFGLSITIKNENICYCERNQSENKQFNLLFKNFKELPAINKAISITV